MKWKEKNCSIRDLPLKKLLLPFVFLIGTSTALGEKENAKLTIKKCCPRGQELNSTLMCVNAMRDLKDNKVNNTEDGEEKTSHPTKNLSEIFPPDFKNISSVNDSAFKELSSWFPFDSLISSLTLKQVTNLESLAELFTEANFEYGEKPECDAGEKEWRCHGMMFPRQFHLVLYPDRDIKLHIAKKSSYHDEGHFKVENRDCGFSKIDLEANNAEEKGRDSPEIPFDPREMRIFPLSDVCMDKGPGESFLVEFCPCKTVPCVRKCCGDSEIFDEGQGKCIFNSTYGFWRPFLENGSLTSFYYLLSRRYPTTCEKPRLLKIPPTSETDDRTACGTQEYLEDRNKFYFLSDGSLKVKKYKKEIPAQSYCGDHVIYDSKIFLENNLLICLEEDSQTSKFLDLFLKHNFKSDTDDTKITHLITSSVYGILFIIGGVVLLITVSISLYLPELRTTVYNKVIICHNVSLMLADFIWGSTYLLSFVTRKVCIALSLAIQCTFLGSFFWMNVMCLDISLGIRRLNFAGETVDDNQRFLWYMIYAWGAPVVITSITAAMEFAPSLLPNYVRPGFGCHNCGFNPDSLAILIYIYGPMIAIIVFNILFYLLTIIQIIKIQKETEILTTENSSTKNLSRGKKRLVIFSKLFLLMGLSWTMEIVGWLVGGKDYYWYLPDFINIFRAVFIFIIFTCKKKVFWSLMRKLKGMPDVAEDMDQSGRTADAEGEGKKKKVLRRQSNLSIVSNESSL